MSTSIGKITENHCVHGDGVILSTRSDNFVHGARAMNMMNCEFCGSPAHIWFNCKLKPDGWMPARLKKMSAKDQITDAASLVVGKTAARLMTSGQQLGKIVESKRAAQKKRARKPLVDRLETAASAQEDVIKRGVGRPRTVADRKAYKAQKERARRASTKSADH